MSNIKTIFHAYSFNLNNADEAAAWEALKASLKASHPRCMESHGGDSHFVKFEKLDGQMIELETTHLFENQWNTAPMDGHNGYRVFDWALDYNPYGNSKLKRGHWLEQTAEMQAVRDNTTKCGYCGKQEPAQKGYVFCPHCLDSEYLKQSDLYLLRMVAVSADKPHRKFPPLTEAESAYLLPLYKDAQLHGSTVRGKVRIAAKRADLQKKFDSAINNAHVEFEGFTWLMDRGISTDNVIYYSHTGRFGFGWRSPVDEGLKDLLLEAISEFPFPYDIKCADGKTLSGG